MGLRDLSLADTTLEQRRHGASIILAHDPPATIDDRLELLWMVVFGEDAEAICRALSRIVRANGGELPASIADEIRNHRRHHGAADGESCPVLTRAGTLCVRMPLENGYCPSHQHLAGPTPGPTDSLERKLDGIQRQHEDRDVHDLEEAYLTVATQDPPQPDLAWGSRFVTWLIANLPDPMSVNETRSETLNLGDLILDFQKLHEDAPTSKAIRNGAQGDPRFVVLRPGRAGAGGVYRITHTLPIEPWDEASDDDPHAVAAEVGPPEDELAPPDPEPPRLAAVPDVPRTVSIDLPEAVARQLAEAYLGPEVAAKSARLEAVVSDLERLRDSTMALADAVTQASVDLVASVDAAIARARGVE